MQKMLVDVRLFLHLLQRGLSTLTSTIRLILRYITTIIVLLYNYYTALLSLIVTL
jgi:hypothetical protein